MVVLRVLAGAAVVLLTAASSQAHHMGRSVPVLYAGGPGAALAGHVLASYFEEQMGRETELSARSTVEECFQAIEGKEAPIAILPVTPVDRLPENVVVVLPGIDTGEGVMTLVMGEDARKDLQFSLVPKYMEKLSAGIGPDAWKRGLERVRAGEGLRKVALDMLREEDLL